MKRAPALAAPLLALLLVAGCGSETAIDDTDPASLPTPAGATPDVGIPPETHGEVETRGVATVMDVGGPELCLGPVAESDPPQCHGIPLKGWVWDEHQGFERSGDVRWGRFLVKGNFDGTALTVTGAVPEAVLDPSGTVRDRDLPSPDAGTLDPQTLQTVLDKLRVHPLPGQLGVQPTPAGALVEVVHDDGSLQDQVDAAYGAGVVVVRSMLVNVVY